MSNGTWMITRRYSTPQRQNRIQPIILQLVFTLGTIAPAIILGQTAEYTVLELPAAADSVKVSLNNLGDVAGRAGNFDGTESQVTVWKPGGRGRKKLWDLFRGEYSSTAGMNDLGEVVGACNGDTAIVPCRWEANGSIQQIPMLAGHSGGQAFGTNNHGDVIGYSSGPSGARAFLWSRKSGIRDLGVLPGGTYSKARAINDRAEAAGISSTLAGERAVLWSQNGSMQNLGTLPGDSSSAATAINISGEVVGHSEGPRGMRAFRWSKKAGLQELDRSDGATSSRASAINGSGDVVGTSTSGVGTHAVVWQGGGKIKDLNALIPADLGIVLFEAHAINEKGQIVATGTNERDRAAEGESNGGDLCAPAPGATFLLSPVAGK